MRRLTIKTILALVTMASVAACQPTTMSMGAQSGAQQYPGMSFVGFADAASVQQGPATLVRTFTRGEETYGSFSNGEIYLLCNPVQDAFPNVIARINSSNAPVPQIYADETVYVYGNMLRASRWNRDENGSCATPLRDIALMGGRMYHRTCGNEYGSGLTPIMNAGFSGTWSCSRGEMRGSGVEGRPGCYVRIVRASDRDVNPSDEGQNTDERSGHDPEASDDDEPGGPGGGDRTARDNEASE